MTNASILSAKFTFYQISAGNFILFYFITIVIFFQKLLKEKFVFEITTFRVGNMEEKARQSQTIFASEKHRYYVRHMFSRIPNLRIHEFFSRNFLSKQGRMFLLRSKVLLKLFLFTKKTL